MQYVVIDESMESWNLAHTQSRIQKLSQQETCSVEDIDFLLTVLKKIIASQHHLLVSLEIIRGRCVIPPRWFTDTIYCAMSANENLFDTHEFVEFRLQVEKEEADKKEDEKNKETSNLCEMFESQSLQ